MKVSTPEPTEIAALVAGYLCTKEEATPVVTSRVIPQLQVTNVVYTWSQNAQDAPGSITAEITVPSLPDGNYYVASKLLRTITTTPEGDVASRNFDMITELGDPGARLDLINRTLFLNATIPGTDPTGGLGGLLTGEFVVFQALIVNSAGEYVGYVELEPYQLVGV